MLAESPKGRETAIAEKKDACRAHYAFSMSSAKLQVRHILFKKIVFLIFLNNLVTVHCARAYCLKRKKQKNVFFFPKYA